MVSNRLTTTDNEDWLRSMAWDLPTDLPGLLGALGISGSSPDQQREDLIKLTGLPAWKPCPEPLRSEILAFIRDHI
jgi:hypothetical protein